MQQVSFRGVSGKAWSFEAVSKDSPWARRAGIAIFAAPEAIGWRPIRIMKLSGRMHNIQPIWALAEAERYGATQVFFSDAADPALRDFIASDLDAGFSPICNDGDMPLAA